MKAPCAGPTVVIDKPKAPDPLSATQLGLTPAPNTREDVPMSDENAASPSEEGSVKTLTRRAPIDLEADVKQVCDDLVTGALSLGDDKFLTPHAISVIVGEKRGGKDHRPSSGAVQAALKRWEEVGYITCNQKPFSFDDYTEAGRTLGLAQCKANYSERSKAARAAQKAAAASPAATGDQPPF